METPAVHEKNEGKQNDKKEEEKGGMEIRKSEERKRIKKDEEKSGVEIRRTKERQRKEV